MDGPTVNAYLAGINALRPKDDEALRHRRSVVIGGTLLLTMLGSPLLLAHPHNWIDVSTKWVFDADGLVRDVKLHWLFDDYYSVLLIDDAATAGEDLESILDKILDNTAKQSHFLWIEQEGVEAEFGDPRQERIAVRDHRVEVEFLLPMTVPLDARRGDIVYRVAEPTYFFEMFHTREGPAIVLKGAPASCEFQIKPPTPDAALIAYAASLGIDESGGDQLGFQFAETVTIRCE